MSEEISKSARGTYLINDTTGEVPQYDFTTWVENNIGNSSAQFAGLDSLNDALADYSKSKPIALLPVRVETKFIGSDLWIRIFPDQIFVKSLEKALTTEEVSDGQDYWNKYALANGLITKQKEAWRFLCAKYGVTRSAWIIRSLFPTNIVAQTGNPNLESALSKVDTINETVNTNYSNYTSPAKVLDFLHSANTDVLNLSKTYSSSNRLKNSEVSLLKHTSDFTRRIFQSKYDAVINPIIDANSLQREDEALVDIWLQVQYSFLESKTSFSFDSDVIGIVKKLNFLKIDLNNHVSGRTTSSKNSVFLKNIASRINEVLLECSAVTLSNENWIKVLKEVSVFKDTLVRSYDSINPYKDPLNPRLGRVDSTLDQVRDQILDDTNEIVNAFSVANKDFSPIILSIFSIVDSIYSFDSAGQSSAVKEQFLVDLDLEIKGAVTLYQSKPRTNIEEIASIYGLVCDVSELLNAEYDNELNPFKIKGKVFSGRADNSLDAKKVIMDLSVEKFKGELISVSRSTGFKQDLDSIELLRRDLFDARVALDGVTFVRACSDALNKLSINLKNYTRNSLEGQVLMLEVLNFFSNYVVVYESEINPPKSAGFPSEGGLDKIVDGLNDIVVASYHQYMNGLLPKGDSLDSFNTLFQVHAAALGYDLEYTRPSVVVSEFDQLKIVSNELRDSLVDMGLNSFEREVLFAATEALHINIYDKFDQGYNPPLDVLDEGKGFRNPSLEIVKEEIFSVLTDVQASNGTVDTSSSNSTFSFQFSGSLVFPNVQVKSEHWTVQEYSDVLPTRFVAIGFDENDSSTDFQGNIKFVEFGNEIDQSIKFGFNPANANSDTDFDIQGSVNSDGNTELQFGESLSWIFDKDIAKEKGLALQIPIGESTYFSKIVVLGINEDIVNVAQHEELLKELIQDHQYTKGISLLSVGTSTNNTSEVPSGYNNNDRLFDEGFETFAQDKLYTPTSDKNKISDGQFFAEFLGLPYSSAYHIGGADRSTITTGHIGARVLFPGTIGMHMEEILDNLLNADNRKRITKFFEDHVSARGLAPSLRIGNRPYGLLVTSNLHNYQVRNEPAFKSIEDFFNFQDPLDPTNDEYPVSSKFMLGENSEGFNIKVKDVKTSVFSELDWQLRFLKRLKQVLVFLDKEWRKVAQNHSKNTYLDNISFHRTKLEEMIQSWENTQDSPAINEEQQSYLNDYAQNHLLSVIGHLPYSYDLGARYAINSGSWNNVTLIQGLDNLLVDVDLAEGIEVPATNPFWHQRMSARVNAAANPNGYSELVNFMNFDLEKGIYTGFDYSTLNGPNKGQILEFANEGLIDKIKYTRAFVTTNALESVRLKGALISASENDKANGTNGYLNWILDNNNFGLLCGSDFSVLPSNSILFLLARASYLAKHRELAMRMMVQEGLSTWPQLMAIGTAENALNSYIRIAHYGNFLPECNYAGNGDYMSQTYVEENAWKFTKWNILLSKFYSNTPYLLGARDSYETLVGLSNQTNTYNAGDIIAYQSWFSNEGQESNFAWRKSKLLKFLAPGIDNPDGIFNINGDETNLKTIADFLLDPSSATGIYSNHQVKNEITKYKSDLDFLAGLSNEELEQITSECIDLSGNRLDAWIHGLFNVRLKQLRNRVSSYNINSPGVSFSTGSYIGAYGYVENLRKRSTAENETSQLTSTNTSELPSELAGLIPSTAQVYVDQSSYGFLPTPSLAHAVTAAILNSTYQSTKVHEASQVYNRSAVNLSSARIRAALFLLQGIQAGNDLGALLGQQFENGLHEASTSGEINLDLTIHRLRKLYPMRTASGSQINSATGSTVQPISGEVVNGIAILDKIKEIYDDFLLPNQSLYETILANLNILFNLNSPLPDDTQDVPPVYEALQSDLTNDELKIIAFHIDQIAQSLDALGDLVITESVYQIANGNHPRAAAAVGMMDGSSGLIDPEVIQSPMKANQFTNRILMNYPLVPEFVSELNATDTIQDAWSEGTIAYSFSPRAGLDQSLNNWLAKLSVSPDQVILTIGVTNALDNTESFAHMTLAQIPFQPLDLISFVNVDSTRPTTELIKVILYYFRKEMALDESVSCRLVFESTDCPDGLLTFQEAYPLICQWKETLIASKPITSHDFSEKAREQKDLGYVVQDLQHRVNTLVQYANDLLVELNAIVAFNIDLATTTEVGSWIACLEKCVKLGISGVVPVSNVVPSGTDQFIAFREKIKVLCEVGQTLLADRITKNSEAVSTWSSIDVSDHAALLSSAKTVVETILGGKTFFNPLIRFEENQVDGTNPLADAISYSSQLLPANEPGHMERWLHANGMVRRNVSSLLNLQISYEVVRNLQSTSGNDSALHFAPIQLPHESDAIWLGMENQIGTNVHGKCNLLVNALASISIEDVTMPQILKRFTTSGFKLDDWNEAIPLQEVTAGIAAHINQPDAEAPQTILLSLPSSEEADWKWNFNDLVMSITQAFDMAKYRSLETEHLGQKTSVDGEESLLGKVFPANMVDVFPTQSAGSSSTPAYDYDGIRPTFNYGENNS